MAHNITWLSSPFLRTLQTSNEAISQFKHVTGANTTLRILPESSVFEWDGKGGTWHSSLPPIAERLHYFPRLDISYQSLLVPTIPEPRSAFHTRCDRAIALLNQRFPFMPRTAIVIVTHAAACVSLVRAATNIPLEAVTPAAPCCIYKLIRRKVGGTDGPVWSIDAHHVSGSMNGHSAHLSDLGANTVPWNHFGDKHVNQGYTKAERETNIDKVYTWCLLSRRRHSYFLVVGVGKVFRVRALKDVHVCVLSWRLQ